MTVKIFEVDVFIGVLGTLSEFPLPDQDEIVCLI
jgi:hypothetical protein